MAPGGVAESQAAGCATESAHGESAKLLPAAMLKDVAQNRPSCRGCSPTSPCASAKASKPSGMMTASATPTSSPAPRAVSRRSWLSVSLRLSGINPARKAPRNSTTHVATNCRNSANSSVPEKLSKGPAQRQPYLASTALKHEGLSLVNDQLQLFKHSPAPAGCRTRTSCTSAKPAFSICLCTGACHEVGHFTFLQAKTTSQLQL